MKISCLDKEVGKMLGESFYKIPRFQRPYSWDQTNLEEFWTDAVSDNQSGYFIGNFVAYQDNDALGVVDGQQRITTITLLLCALRDMMQDEGFSDLATGIHYLIERPNIQNEKFYVIQTETSYPFFQQYVQKFEKKKKPTAVGPEEELLKSAYEFLGDRIRERIEKVKVAPILPPAKLKLKIREELSKIRDSVLGLKLIFTSLDNDDDAYVIFETLNTRGKDLTLSDLVKSHLSRLLKPGNKGVDLTKDNWLEIAETFEESQADLNISTFIHHFWLSRYDYVTEKKLYKALRKQIKKDNAQTFLDDLVTESAIYRQIQEPTYKKWKKDDLEIRDSLAGMNTFRIKQQLPMVLAVMRHHADETLKQKSVKKMLSAIEDFHFAFTAIASQRSSGGISFMYASAAKNLHEANTAAKKAKILQNLRTKLKSKLPPYAEFEARFLELRYSSKFTKQKNLVRYILGNLCGYHTSGVSLDFDRMTVEHIAPENPAQPSTLGPEYIASIGNLLFIDQGLNEKLENKSFSEKKKILGQANVWMDDDLKNASVWGQSEIQARAKSLADVSFNKIWKL